MPKLDKSDNQALGLTLRGEMKRSEEARFLHRMHCVILIGQGYSCQKVAKLFDTDPSTVARWIRHFKEVGIVGLRDNQKPGRPCKISTKQRNTLEQDLIKTPADLGYTGARWDGKLLAIHLQRQYDVSLGVRQCQRLIRQLRQPL